ncbi:MAG: HlyD family efflux transporter periplasmic adaptor subunit [Magnetococcales bacterium]|nr:HlyD family efflux transporter periplasmic adaptor subunit [Magnetococcales bacterium]
MAEDNRAVQIESAYLTPIRHPIKAARLLYSAPSWTLSGPIHIIAAIVIASLVYSFWAKKDELVVAPMTLVRDSVTLEAVQQGMVSRIHVQEGALVDTLDPLVEVQKTRVTQMFEEESLKGKKSDIEDKLKDLERESITQIADLDDKIDALHKETAHERRQLELSIKNVKKDRALLSSQLTDAKRLNRSLNSKLKVAKQELRENEQLYKSRDITRQERDRSRMKVDDTKKSAEDARSKVRQTEIALAALSESKLRNELGQLKVRYATRLAQLKRQRGLIGERFKTDKKRMEDRKTSTGRKIEEEARLIFGVSHEGKFTHYRSRFQGLVTQVHVSFGEIITPGQPLVTIVNSSAELKGMVYVQNSDIGKLKIGQTLNIKYFAYPYQEWGIPTGTITSIASKPGGGPKEMASMYLVEIGLNSDTISKRGSKPRPLVIGLEGMGEIVTGQKRFIELLFRPIARFFTQEE